jgi:hypothetical protein
MQCPLPAAGPASRAAVGPQATVIVLKDLRDGRLVIIDADRVRSPEPIHRIGESLQ